MNRLFYFLLAVLLLCGVSFSSSRIYYQNFDDTTKVESFWLERNPSAKRVVGASDGAIIKTGNCLRGNWFINYTDPITKLTTDTGEYCHFTLYDLYLDDKGISDSVYVDYWAFIDSNAQKRSGIKWVWLQGHHGTTWTWNYYINPPDDWDRWWISPNNDQSFDGGYDHDTLLSQIAGITSLMQQAGQTDVNKWFQGRWHHFQFYIKQNTPASAANGVLKFWIDDVLILNSSDFRWRINDNDSIYFFSTPHMYGGGSPPPSSFGWQLDEMQVWNGMPPAAAANLVPSALPTPVRKMVAVYDVAGRRQNGITPRRGSASQLLFTVTTENGKKITSRIITPQ
jgi:hypothetical protein